MFNPELKPLQPASPGHARLTIRNWDGAGENVTLTLQRNQDRNYLNDEGHWVGNAFEHRLSLIPDGDNYQIDLDKQFVDPLVTNLQMAYRLTLRDDEGNQDIGTLKIDSGVQSSQALGHQETLKSGAILSTTAPVAVAAEPEPAEQEVPETAPDELTAEPDLLQAVPADAPVKKKKSPAGFIITVILLLAVAGALVWFFVLKDKTTHTPPVPPVPAEQTEPEKVPPAAEPETPKEPAVTEPKPEPVPAEPAPAAAGAEEPCSAESMKTGTALAFVQRCLKSHPNDPAILSTIEAAVANKQCDVAQRLYAYKAQAGDAGIAFKYAQEYDPDVTTPGGCFSADKETAIYWYEAALRSDPQNTEAKARLDALKK